MKNKAIIVLGAVAALGLTATLTLLLTRPSGNSPDSASAQSSRNGMGGMHHMQVSSEFNYLAQMIPHHQEAIDTAQVILARTSRPEMRQFAQNIIQAQTAEIAQMKNWLNQWYPSGNISISYVPMMRDLSQLQGDALDQTFLQDMIKHHMGAVMMSQMLLNHNLVKHQPVQPFAENIATSQRQEIQQMQTWLMAWFGDRNPMGGMHH
ncbi:MAG: DUF305 domain-containing protein [Microcystis aeruginosa Ma_QC_Ca_00000000_S207]|nr:MULTISPECIES: DUF305 domain-containing protein [unclassified Microcystis]TRU47898.1 MAG: DUF305 domain-containing protein [Microcystis aeruginosa Ma_QC_Ca_00000000_S207]